MTNDENRFDEMSKVTASNARAIQSLGNDTREKINRILTALERLIDITEAVAVQYQSPLERQQEIIIQMQELIARMVKIDESQEQRIERLEATIEVMKQTQERVEDS
jgi:ATP phosphoribosyltransferase